MFFHDDLYETMQGGKMKYKVGDTILIRGYGKGEGDGFVPMLDGQTAKIVDVNEISASYIVYIPSLEEKRCASGWSIPERYAEEPEDRTDYRVGIGKVQFVNLDAPEFQITVFKELGFDVVVVTGITLETLKADPRPREALAQLLEVWRRPTP